MNAPAPALQAAVQRAVADGVLPEDATLAEQDARPWPVVLLTGLGAWLAAIPLLGVVGLLLGDLIARSFGPYFVGALLLGAAVTVLRSRGLAIFVEQLAVPALLVGGGSLAFGLFRDLPLQAAAAVLAFVALGLAWAIDRPWLRVLLGAAAAGLAIVAVLPRDMVKTGGAFLVPAWLALHAALGLWLAVMAWLREGAIAGDDARAASTAESAGAGWVLLVLAGLAAWSGMAFLLAGTLGFWGELARDVGVLEKPVSLLLYRVASSALALGAAAVVARAWPSLRRWDAGAVAAVLAGLSAFLPALGGVLLALAWTATTQRWRLAGAAAFAAAWIIGAFYYQLQWPLAQKALVLVVAALLLGAIAWLARAPREAAPAATQPGTRRSTLLVALGALATLAVANFAIWEKESLIANGDKVYVELAPVDPRSLMQGDFMRLNFRLPDTQAHALAGRRPHAALARDARGVAVARRIVQPGEALAPGEMRIELTPKDGRWTLVTDAWFFREGDAKRWEAARFGEFRVLPDGRALLVGLADAQLRTIPISP